MKIIAAIVLLTIGAIFGFLAAAIIILKGGDG